MHFTKRELASWRVLIRQTLFLSYHFRAITLPLWYARNSPLGIFSAKKLGLSLFWSYSLLHKCPFFLKLTYLATVGKYRNCPSWHNNHFPGITSVKQFWSKLDSSYIFHYTLFHHLCTPEILKSSQFLLRKEWETLG